MKVVDLIRMSRLIQIPKIDAKIIVVCISLKMSICFSVSVFGTFILSDKAIELIQPRRSFVFGIVSKYIKRHQDKRGIEIMMTSQVNPT